jgi:hypothetical protein
LLIDHQPCAFVDEKREILLPANQHLQLEFMITELRDLRLSNIHACFLLIEQIFFCLMLIILEVLFILSFINHMD